jgi:hypothetical protein
MRLIKCFVVFGLSFLTGTCGLPSNLDIDIGDYNNQLEAWNSQNMLDYQMVVRYFATNGSKKYANITVKNAIPESSNPLEWIANGRLSTVPEFYSYIKREEKRIRDSHKKNINSYSLKVRYDTTYHYPREIEDSFSNKEHPGLGSHVSGTWTISVWPVYGETEAGSGEE